MKGYCGQKILLFFFFVVPLFLCCPAYAGTVTNTGASTTPMSASGAGNSLVNAPTGTLSTSSTAFSVINGATANNAGAITTDAVTAYGVYVQDGSANNSGSITTKNDKSHAFYGKAATLKNSGTLSTEGTSSHGTYFVRGTVTNTVLGHITTSGDYASGIYATWGTAINNGTIANSGKNTSGITAVGGSGMPAAVAKNNGTITTGAGENSRGMYGVAGATLTNGSQGQISVDGVGARAIVAKNRSVVVNDGLLKANAERAFGVLAEANSTVENSGTIQTYGDGSYAVLVKVNSFLENKGTLFTDGKKAHGVFATSSSNVVNSGTIKTQGKISFGIYGQNTEIVNNGTITTSGNSAPAMRGDGGKVLNTKNLVTSGTGSYGIFARAGAHADNSGTITTSGAAASAAFLFGASFHNTGTLSASGNSAHAVFARNSSTVELATGTRIVQGNVCGDASSRLTISADTPVFFATNSFGTITHPGQGVWNVTGDSDAGSVSVSSGRVSIANGTTFTVQSFSQSGGELEIQAGGTTSGLLHATSSVDLGNRAVLFSPSTSSASQVYRIIKADGANYSNYDTVSITNPHFDLVNSGWDGDTLEVEVAYSPKWDNSAIGAAVVTDLFASIHEAVRFRIDSMIGPLAASNHSDDADGLLLASFGNSFGLLTNEEGSAWHPYVQMLGVHAERENFGGRIGYESLQRGVSLGIDRRFDSIFGGFHATYVASDIDFNLHKYSQRDREDQELFSLGTYWSVNFGPWLIRDSLSASLVKHSSERYSGLGDYAKAKFTSMGIGNSLFGGYEISHGNWLFVPEAGVNYFYLHREAFSEHNSAAPLSYSALNLHSLESELDFTVKYRFGHDDMVFMPFARLGWIHSLGNNDITVHQMSGGLEAFVVQPEDDDSFKCDLGLIFLHDDCEVTFAYSGELSEHSRQHGALAKVKLAF